MEFTLYFVSPSPPPSLSPSFSPSLFPLSLPSPVSIATVSEYQRFLSRLVAHKTLRIEQPFIVFLTGTIEVRKQNTVITLHSIITLNCQIRFIKHQLKIYKLFCRAQSGRDSC